MRTKGLTEKERKFVILKASGLSAKKSALLAYPGIKEKSAESYSSQLLKKERIRRELETWKKAFRDKFIQKAFENWKEILETKPEGAPTWKDYIGATFKTFELAGLKEKENENISKKIEFIKQFYITEEKEKTKEKIKTQE